MLLSSNPIATFFYYKQQNIKNMNIKSKSALYCLSIACMILGVKESQAAVVATESASTSGIATSYAGAATGSHDISDSFSNAAVLSDVKSNQVLVGATYIHLDVKANDIVGSSGTSSNTTTTDVGVPAFYIAMPINKKAVFGFAVTSPFGLTTKYDSNWAGRDSALTSKMATVNLNPSIAYSINDKLSVAVGLQAQYMDLKLTNTLTSSPTTVYRVNSSSWGYGFNLGTKYKFSDKITAGIGYRSSIKQKLEGKADYGTLASNFRSELNTPEIVTAGISYKLNEKLELLYDTSWSRWSRVKSFVITADNSLLSGATTFNWRDTFKYSFGANYQHTERLVLRAGVAYETDATTNTNREPRIPGGARTWLSTGFGYKICDNSQIDFAYAHLFYKDTKTNLPTRAAGGIHALSSNNETAIDAVSMSWKYSF
jgi:long-chain fatty acid transport protein